MRVKLQHCFAMAWLLLAAALPMCAPAQTAATPAVESLAHKDATEDVGGEDMPAMLPHFKDSRYWLSGSVNFIAQAHPEFHAEYSGAQSMTPHYEKATSRLMTLYGGVRLNDSLEFLGNLEEAGGAALSTGFGMAGFTNLDIVRNPSLGQSPYLARGIVHVVIALSDDTVENQRSPLSLFERLPRRRLEIRFGKMSTVDFFDQNSAGSDTHFQFSNWTVDNNGAYDYAADTRGYTVGVVADYEDRNWGFRLGEMLMPKVANGIDLVWKPWQVHSENFEYELRRGLVPHKSGTVRLLAYVNSTDMGVYREAVRQYLDGQTAVPDITNHAWRITRKYGFGANVEQQVVTGVTGFARFGWNNGKTESFAYTEVDQTVEAGVGAMGARWHRKYDRAGVAFVSNGIARDHQQYLALGGKGFLLGDGGLRYGRENIVEMYYTAHLWRGVYAAPGFQRVSNPGYNRARGPVDVPSLRLHMEF